MRVNADPLRGSRDYGKQAVETGNMVYKHDAFRPDHAKQKGYLSRTQVTLKLIPDIDGTPAIAQLVAIKFANVAIHGAWTGRARLELIPSVNCPLADLPVRQVVCGVHMVTDMTLPYGTVIHDYLKK